MSAALVAIESSTTNLSTSARAERRFQEFLNRLHALADMLVDARLLTYRHDDTTPVGQAHEAMYLAACA